MGNRDEEYYKEGLAMANRNKNHFMPTKAVSSSETFDYAKLPFEIQEQIADGLDQRSLRNWCFVNRHSYKVTLRCRYRSVKFSTPVAAESFSRHEIHDAFHSTRHVRRLFIDLPAGVNPSDWKKYQDAIQTVASNIKELYITVGNGSTYTSWTMGQLLGNQTSIEKLSMISLDEAWFAGLENTQFSRLHHLNLQLSHHAFSTDHSARLLCSALSDSLKTVKALTIGYAINDSMMKNSHHVAPQPLERSKSISVSEEAESRLETLTFNEISFARSKVFASRMFNECEAERLSILHCTDLGPVWDTIFATIPSWTFLTELDFILPSTRPWDNPTNLSALEKLLGNPSELSLKRLRIEIPAAGRLPCASVMTAQSDLESLIVGVTDENGLWISYKSDALQLIAEHCIWLKLLGVTLPANQSSQSRPEAIEHFFKSSNLETILIFGIENISRDKSSPAWVQKCPRHLTKDRTEPETATLDSMHQSILGLFNDGTKESSFMIGIHLGEYYCERWTKELVFFNASRESVERISPMHVPLSEELEHLFQV